MGKQYFQGYCSCVVTLFIFRHLKHCFWNTQIPNLEFESQGFLENQVFRPTEQAETNICSMKYQNINFKIRLTLFGWKENILPIEHIVHRFTYYHGSDSCNDIYSIKTFMVAIVVIRLIPIKLILTLQLTRRLMANAIKISIFCWGTLPYGEGA